MANEKLTPWDAPYTKKQPMPRISSSLSMSASPPPWMKVPKKNQPDPKWYEFRKKYKGKSLMQTPLFYVWYLALIGINAFMIFSDGDLDGFDIITGGSIGFIIGVMLFTSIQRKTRDWDKKIAQMDFDFERARMRLEMDRVQREAQIMVKQAQRDADDRVRRALGQI